MDPYRYERTIPAEGGWDLVVAGGGPAGTAAAVCAARLGAKVLLAEQTGCLGGMGTSGLVCAFDPMADGERTLVGGLQLEIVETLYARGELPPQVTPAYWRSAYHRWTPFPPEALKRLLDELVTVAGVEVRFFTRVIDADADAEAGRVRGVVLENVEGLRYVEAPAFVDATGDACLADACGAAYRQAGRDTEAIMPPTLCSLHAGIDWDAIRDFERSANYRSQVEAYHQALEDGLFSQYDRQMSGALSRVGRTLGYLNSGHVFGTDATNCGSVTAAMMHGRRLVGEFVRFFRERLPWCREMELVATAPRLGVRESRRIVGEYELAFDDYLARRQFPDQVGVFNKFVDIHPVDCSDAEWERFQEEKDRTGRLGPGECFGLPYGILVPRGWANLWVAGRCASADVKVHGSIRVMPAASMMGQAAGTAAVQSVRTGRPAGAIDTARLVETLREQGAYLPQADLRPTLTRA